MIYRGDWRYRQPFVAVGCEVWRLVRCKDGESLRRSLHHRVPGMRVISSPVCWWLVLETLFEWFLGMCPILDTKRWPLGNFSFGQLIILVVRVVFWGDKLSLRWFLDVASHLQSLFFPGDQEQEHHCLRCFAHFTWRGAFRELCYDHSNGGWGWLQEDWRISDSCPRHCHQYSGEARSLPSGGICRIWSSMSLALMTHEVVLVINFLTRSGKKLAKFLAALHETWLWD